jgi:hypothetical protein
MPNSLITRDSSRLALDGSQGSVDSCDASNLLDRLPKRILGDVGELSKDNWEM